MEEASEVRRHRCIVLVRRLGVDAVICFLMPSQTEGTAYSVGDGGILFWWCNTMEVAEAEEKREVGANCE